MITVIMVVTFLIGIGCMLKGFVPHCPHCGDVVAKPEVCGDCVHYEMMEDQRMVEENLYVRDEAGYWV
jgi:NAD-dependent SIR2 family protein deacetylase